MFFKLALFRDGSTKPKSAPAKLNQDSELLVNCDLRDTGEVTIGGVYYFGEASVGSSPSDPVWRVCRRVTSPDGITLNQYANGGESACVFSVASLPNYSYGS